MDLAGFLEAFGSWARTQPDVAGVALVGSYARNAGTTGSDLDLIILTTAVAKYFQNQSWVSQFGEVQKCESENWGRVETLRVFYRDQVEVEYNFSAPDWAEVPIDEGTRRVVADGMEIIFDPQGLLKTLQQQVL